MGLKISNHQLSGTAVSYVDTPNTSGKFQSGQPDTIIIHYTAGANAQSSVDALTNPNVKASAHLVIGSDGKIFQLASFDTITWHAGKSSYGNRSGFNKYSIGIEIDNAGPLDKAGDKYVSWFGREYEESQVMQATHRNEHSPRYWHRFTQFQITTVESICRLLIQEYGIKHILGHEEISPGRKSDPGPAFPLDRLRNVLLNNDREVDEGAESVQKTNGVVSVDKLNIRSGPSSDHDKVAMALKNGSRVKIIEKDGNWLRVRTEIEGWVHGRYIDTEN